MFEEAAHLFYANMTIPEVPGGTDSIIRSNLLETLIEFSLFDLCEILDLPKEGDYVYLMAFDHLPAYGKIESEVYSLISVNGEKPKTATGLKPDFRVISKWFVITLFLVVITMICPTSSEFVSLFPPRRLKSNMGYIIFNSMRSTYAAISSPNPPALSKDSLSYGIC